MSGHVRQLLTEDERERFHLARNRGGQCAACGRLLDDREPVYIDQFRDHSRVVIGPVGAECASEAFLDAMRGREPEQCAGCGRGVYYRTAKSSRHWVLCSRWCRPRAHAARQRQVEG